MCCCPPCGGGAVVMGHVGLFVLRPHAQILVRPKTPPGRRKPQPGRATANGRKKTAGQPCHTNPSHALWICVGSALAQCRKTAGPPHIPAGQPGHRKTPAGPHRKSHALWLCFGSVHFAAVRVWGFCEGGRSPDHQPGNKRTPQITSPAINVSPRSPI